MWPFIDDKALNMVLFHVLDVVIGDRGDKRFKVVPPLPESVHRADQLAVFNRLHEEWR